MDDQPSSILDSEYQIHPKLTGVMGLNPLLRESSAPRLYMFFGQLSQAMTTKGVTPNMFSTFAEDEFGKYTFSVKMPHRGEVYRVIRKYPTTDYGSKSVQSPLTLAIYQNLESDVREFDVLELPLYHTMHQHFGYSYVGREALNRIRPQGVLRKGEEVLGCPGVWEDGTFCYGTETNLALMTLPDVIEDGALVSEEWLETQQVECFGKRVIRFGRDEIPMNIYGDDRNYKIVPDIGDRIHEDGLLFASRKVDPLLACVQLLPRNLRHDRILPTDRLTYAIPNAEVVNVTVLKGRGNTPSIPEEMETQLRRYYDKARDFYKQIYDTEIDLYRNFGNKIRFTPALHRLFVDARAYLETYNGTSNVEPRYGKLKVNDWLVVVDYRYKLTPDIGWKISDSQGAKAVIVAKRPRREMPTDMHGNVADVVMDPNSTVKRSNVGRTTEQWIKASLIYHGNVIRGMLSEGKDEEAWEYLLGYMKILSPAHHRLLLNPELDKKHELSKIRRRGIRCYAPTDNPVAYYQAIDQLEKEGYGLPIGPVSYVGNSGNRVTTKQEIVIGPVYMYLLEKDARTWAAVTSARLHPSYGTPTKLGASDKHRSPGKESATKTLRETEERLYYAACGGYAVSQVIERSNNPLAHRSAVRNVLKSKHPTDIVDSVNWNEVPVTGGRPLQFLTHMYNCMGIGFEIPEENRRVDFLPPGY